MKYASYSFSKMDTYQTCPKKFEYQYILKMKEKSNNYALEKGNLSHNLIEYILKNKLKDFVLPTDFEYLNEDNVKEVISTVKSFCLTNDFKEIRQDIKNYPSIVEGQFFLDGNFMPCKSKRKSLINGKIDLAIKMDDCYYISDWKTGSSLEKEQKWAKKKDQLELYAIWGLQQTDYVNAHYHFVDFPHKSKYSWTKEDLPELIYKWQHKIQTIEETEIFDKKISKLCEYCQFQEICKN